MDTPKSPIVAPEELVGVARIELELASVVLVATKVGFWPLAAAVVDADEVFAPSVGIPKNVDSPLPRRTIWKGCN